MVEDQENKTWEEGRENLTATVDLRNRAEGNWSAGNYSAADVQIEGANNHLQNIFEEAPGAGLPWLIVALVIWAIVGVGSYFYTHEVK